MSIREWDMYISPPGSGLIVEDEVDRIHKLEEVGE